MGILSNTLRVANALPLSAPSAEVHLANVEEWIGI